MKLIQCVTAYIALSTLSKKEFSYDTSYKIVKLRQELASDVDFYAAEEKKLVERFAKLDETGAVAVRGGEFFYKGETEAELRENRAAFERARAELGAIEIDREIDTVSLVIPAGVRVSPETIEALGGLVEFEVEK